jgi:chromate reductase, NAD(P)H dehydrogenase (quinone)
MKRIAVIVGSLQKKSFSRNTALALAEVAPKSLALELVEIGQLPLYNQELDANPPSEWIAFKKQIQGYDGLLFVTPEHNRSYPAALKNALDIASRPYGESVWSGKPGAVVSVSPGSLAGFGANHHLRQVLAFLNIPTMAQPEAYVGNAYMLFDENGKLTDENTRQHLTDFINAYAEWVDIFVK